MTPYQIEPSIIRVIPFEGEGGALAAVDIRFGPIVIAAKLYESTRGMFLSYPSRKNEAQDKWYQVVTVTDPELRIKAQTKAVLEYKEMMEGSRVAVV